MLSVLFYSEHLVAIVHDRWTMCNENDRLLVVCENIFQKLALRVWIKSRGGLVEKHDVAVAQQGTGNRYALGLPLLALLPRLGLSQSERVQNR